MSIEWCPKCQRHTLSVKNHDGEQCSICGMTLRKRKVRKVNRGKKK